MEVSAYQIIGLVRRREVPPGKTEQWAKHLSSRRWLNWLSRVALLAALVVIWWTDPTATTWARVKSVPGIMGIGLFLLGGVLAWVADRKIYRLAYQETYGYLGHYYKTLEILKMTPQKFMAASPTFRQALAESQLRTWTGNMIQAQAEFQQTRNLDTLDKESEFRTKFAEAYAAFAGIGLIPDTGWGPYFQN